MYGMDLYENYTTTITEIQAITPTKIFTIVHSICFLQSNVHPIKL